jgi:hypothetical protein
MKAPSLLSKKDPEGMKTFLSEYSVDNRTSTRIRKGCPTLNPIVFGLRLLARDRDFNMEQASELIDDPSEVLLYRALVAKKDGRIQQWADLLREMAGQRRNDPRPAFLLLAHSRLGTYRSLEEDEANELAEHLDDRYKQLLTAVDAISRNDLGAVRQYESQLASYGLDEIGSELAVRMRILWRITDQGPDRQYHNLQALQLIARAVPFLGEDALIPFRVAAAIGADQPDVALACSVGYAKSVVERIKRKEITEVSRLESLRSNLIKCRSMIADRRPFQAVSEQRYSRALEYLNKVISGDV